MLIDVWALVNSAGLLFLILLVISVVRRFRVTIENQQKLIQAGQQKVHALSQQLSETETTNIQHQQQTLELSKQINAVTTQLKELASIVSTLPNQQQQLDLIQQAINKAENELQMIQSETSEQKLYGRAKKMIEMGAEVEELIAECGMPRGEAELLLSLYKKAN